MLIYWVMIISWHLCVVNVTCHLSVLSSVLSKIQYRSWFIYWVVENGIEHCTHNEHPKFWPFDTRQDLGWRSWRLLDPETSVLISWGWGWLISMNHNFPICGIQVQPLVCFLYVHWFQFYQAALISLKPALVSGAEKSWQTLVLVSATCQHCWWQLSSLGRLRIDWAIICQIAFVQYTWAMFDIFR